MTFVGRDTELAALQVEFDAARGGAPRVVHVVGPPGIGKSTLVERFLERNRARVLRAGGDESERDVELGVADQLLRHAGGRALDADHVTAGARLLDALGELQADGPVVVLVDDAQWADAAS